MSKLINDPLLLMAWYYGITTIGTGKKYEISPSKPFFYIDKYVLCTLSKLK